MQFLKICKFSLLLALPTLIFAKSIYLVEMAPRGIIFSDTSTNTAQFLEPRLCIDDHCLFIEKRELDLLNIDLGDNEDEIFANLNKMSEFDKDWLSMRLRNLHRQEI